MFSDVRSFKTSSGSLTERKNYSNGAHHTSLEKYSYTYNKHELSEYLKKKVSLIAYMTLVLKITELADRAIKSGVYTIFTVKNIIVMTC